MTLLRVSVLEATLLAHCSFYAAAFGEGAVLLQNFRARIVLILVAAMLQGCGFGISSFSLGRSSTGTSLAEEEATGSDVNARPTNVSVTKSDPLEAYIAVGGTIKRCWFNATDPLLPNHVYRADVSPGGSKVEITVHQRAKLGRAGVAAAAAISAAVVALVSLYIKR